MKKAAAFAIALLTLLPRHRFFWHTLHPLSRLAAVAEKREEPEDVLRLGLV
jgi:hypothetical protein